MKAAILRQLGRFEIEDVTLDAPRATELRIRTLASGLCHSDYHAMTGDMAVPLPVVAGHEAAGVVEAVGEDVRGFKAGDLVVTCASGFCGHCRECQTGHNHRCDAPLPARPGATIRGCVTVTANRCTSWRGWAHLPRRCWWMNVRSSPCPRACHPRLQP